MIKRVFWKCQKCSKKIYVKDEYFKLNEKYYCSKDCAKADAFVDITSHIAVDDNECWDEEVIEETKINNREDDK